MKKQRIVIALGGNALGKNLPEQYLAVQETSRAIADLIEDGNEVIISHGNGPQVGMINNAMAAFSRSDPAHPPITPLSVCVAMSQAYIGYDLQNALKEELLNRGIRKSVATVITQIRVNENDPAFAQPTKPIGHFMTKEEADEAVKEGIPVTEDAG
ncbi:MAG: carbamate kinase, partial [Clostridiales bacterium]|nr:carbamate kinase [Clostridiales bacterium]